jgi:Phage tail assembly chaperone protein, TAC
MTFGDATKQLCGQSAILLGWMPSEFWEATPAELACILDVLASQNELPPDSGDIQELLKQFPDG